MADEVKRGGAVWGALGYVNLVLAGLSAYSLLNGVLADFRPSLARLSLVFRTILQVYEVTRDTMLWPVSEIVGVDLTDVPSAGRDALLLGAIYLAMLLWSSVGPTSGGSFRRAIQRYFGHPIVARVHSGGPDLHASIHFRRVVAQLVHAVIYTAYPIAALTSWWLDVPILSTLCWGVLATAGLLAGIGLPAALVHIFSGASVAEVREVFTLSPATLLSDIASALWWNSWRPFVLVFGGAAVFALVSVLFQYVIDPIVACPPDWLWDLANPQGDKPKPCDALPT